LFNVKPPARRVYAPEGKTKISTTPVKYASHFTGQAGILEVFRGLKFESDEEIGQKRVLCAKVSKYRKPGVEEFVLKHKSREEVLWQLEALILPEAGTLGQIRNAGA